jgi:hypothetical protein
MRLLHPDELRVSSVVTATAKGFRFGPCIAPPGAL